MAEGADAPRCTRSEQVDIAELLERQDSRECLDFLRHCDRCDDCAEAVRNRSRPVAASAPRAPVLAERRAALIGGGGLAVVAVLLGGYWLLAGGSTDVPERGPVPASPAEMGQAAAPGVQERDPSAPVGDTGGAMRDEPAGTAEAVETVRELTLTDGEVLEVRADALPKGEPVSLVVSLPVASTSDEPRPVRIVAAGREPLETLGHHASDDRRRARVEIEPGWLEPGRYIVEVKTTERTHIPLRRYVLIVR